MFTIIKDNQKITVSNRSSLSVYLSNGWELLGEVTEPKVVEVVEPTKKEIQQQLDAKGIEYSPRDNKTTLLDKLEGSKPTDNFDDGLLKG
jgi:hypothetical protein